MRVDLPSGTVTFLFTDVEGSTKLLHELGTESYAEALDDHRRLIREACAAHGGVEVDTQGDAFFFAFLTAPGALAAAADMTEALALGPIHVRIGLHTGTPVVTEEGYVGADVHRVARIAAAGHGGQVLVASSTAELVAAPLTDLGQHRFKDLSAPERLYQLGDGEFPPLKTLYQSNLPILATPFIERDRELADVLELLVREDVRLLTLTGPGGTGKTRLAVQAAADAADDYEHGVWWVPLATLRDPALVVEQAVQVLGAKRELFRHIDDKHLLLLFDNFEQVVQAGPNVAELVAACPKLNVLVTSREPLHVTGEQEYPVPPLVETEAVELFHARARAVVPSFTSSGVVADICRRLDNLPLAIELAASRVIALSPEQILERMEKRLPLLTRGPHDVPKRQRTLHATIEWSYDLLSPEEQRLFARLSVFAGGCTLEAPEEVCDADLDTVQSLVEKSLLRFSNERFWMLETIRELATERLAETAESDLLLEGLGRYLVSRARAEGAPRYEPRQAAAYARLEPEHANTRVAMEWALSKGQPELACELVGLLFLVWLARGHVSEAREWTDAALQYRGAVADPIWAFVLIAASDVRKAAGDVAGAVEVTEELVATMSDNTSVDPLTVASALADLSDIAREEGDLGRASEYAERSLEYRRAHGLRGARALSSLAELAFEKGDLERAEHLFERAADDYAGAGHASNYAGAIAALAELARRRGDTSAAVERLTEALEIGASLGDQAWVGECLQGLARVAADQGRLARAGTLWGAGEELQDLWGVPTSQRRYRDAPMPELPKEAVAAGAAMDVNEAVEYALRP